MPDTFAKTIADVEADLKLPKGFLVRLLDEDDWSFVIKAHSLFEALLNRLLVESIGKPELSGVIESMAMGSKRQGKLAFIHALQLIPDSLFRFLVGLTQLRNGLVHRIENVTFSFSEYVSSLSATDQNNFYEWARHGETAEVTVGDVTVSRREHVLRHTKDALAGAVIVELACVYQATRMLSALKRVKLPHGKTGLDLMNRALNKEVKHCER